MPPPPCLVCAYYLQPPDARAIFLHNDLLCNETCSVTGGGITYWGGHKRKRSSVFYVFDRFCCFLKSLFLIFSCRISFTNSGINFPWKFASPTNISSALFLVDGFALLIFLKSLEYGTSTPLENEYSKILMLLIGLELDFFLINSFLGRWVLIVSVLLSNCSLLVPETNKSSWKATTPLIPLSSDYVTLWEIEEESSSPSCSRHNLNNPWDVLISDFSYPSSSSSVWYLASERPFLPM